MKWWLIIPGVWLVLTVIGPIYLWLSGQVRLDLDWRTASRATTHMAPLPSDHPQALVQLYTARAFNWRGLFATHTWLAVKSAHAKHYTIYQVIGWNLYRKQSVVSVTHGLPDREWFGAKPKVFAQISGSRAQRASEELKQAARAYPYRDIYVVLPGPNSNTFIAELLRHCPACRMVMPGNAVGQYYLPKYHLFARTPSGTGVEIQLAGLVGVSVGYKEGFMLNVLGLSYGINPWQVSITLPGFGTMGLFHRG